MTSSKHICTFLLFLTACDDPEIEARKAVIQPCQFGDDPLACPGDNSGPGGSSGGAGDDPGSTSSASGTGEGPGSGEGDDGGGPTPSPLDFPWVVDNDACKQGEATRLGNYSCVTVGCWPHTTGKSLRHDYCVYDPYKGPDTELQLKIWDMGHRTYETTQRVFASCNPVSILDGDDCVFLIEQLDRMSKKSVTAAGAQDGPCVPEPVITLSTYNYVYPHNNRQACAGSTQIGAMEVRQLAACGTKYPYTCMVTECAGVPVGQPAYAVQEAFTQDCFLSL